MAMAAAIPRKVKAQMENGGHLRAMDVLGVATRYALLEQGRVGDMNGQRRAAFLCRPSYRQSSLKTED